MLDALLNCRLTSWEERQDCHYLHCSRAHRALNVLWCCHVVKEQDVWTGPQMVLQHLASDWCKGRKHTGEKLMYFWPKGVLQRMDSQPSIRELALVCGGEFIYKKINCTFFTIPHICITITITTIINDRHFEGKRHHYFFDHVHLNCINLDTPVGE